MSSRPRSKIYSSWVRLFRSYSSSEAEQVLYSSASSLPPLLGIFPNARKQNMQPTLQISIFSLKLRFCISSGAMNSLVPLTVIIWKESSSHCCEMLKSMSFRVTEFWPSISTSMFSGLISLWQMNCLCRWATAWRSCLRISLIYPGCRPFNFWSSVPLACSITMWLKFSVEMKSNAFMMFGWSSFERMWYSFWLSICFSMSRFLMNLTA